MAALFAILLFIVGCSGNSKATVYAETSTSAPVVTSVTPASGLTAGGTTVTIAGSNFTGATSVKFGTSLASDVTVNSADSITAVSPIGTGSVHVTVDNPTGTSTTSASDLFTYVPAPAITNLNPTSGMAGVSVTIIGTNFGTGKGTVTFGGTPATITNWGEQEIVATVPPSLGAGTTSVLVATASNQTVTTTFTVTAGDAQTCTASAIPCAALMKYQPEGTTNYVFNPSTLLTPPSAPADAAPMIQAAINAIAAAHLSKGGVIFLAPGTYLLKHPLTFEGDGVTLVGVRAQTSSGQTGAYPTLTYDDSFDDTDYDNRANTESSLGFDVPLLDNPAVIRFNGNSDYSQSGSYDYGGLIGINVAYVGTAGSGSEGDKATGIATNLPHQALFHDLTVDNAYNGLDVGSGSSPYFRGITITNVRGSFGARLGTSSTAALKMHALTVTASPNNTSTTLVIIPANMELIGANLTGGRVGIDIDGGSSDTFADDIYIRSVNIQNTAQQGILVNYASGTYINDTTVSHAGAEAIKVLPGFYGGLAITNLTATYSGFSAVRVQRGMNINIANAILLNSGQNKSNAGSEDLPIADLSVDSSVTSLNIVGGKLGSVAGTALNEDWGVYVSTASPLYTPWHTPTIIASNLDFMSLPSSREASGITVSDVNGYTTLNSAGYFNPPVEDTWSIQGLPTDPALSGPLSVVKGFNSYDLCEIRDRQWINLTSSALSSYPVVDSSGNINPQNFTYWENIAAEEFPEGVVFYLPSGYFNSDFTSYTRKIYTISGTLVINKQSDQLVGDGRNVTQITDSNATPTTNVIQLISGSDGSGVYGLTVIYSKTAALTAPGAPVTYAPPYLVQGTSKIRLANIGSHYSMGGELSIIDTTNSELFDVTADAPGGNNSQPTVPLGIFTVTATSEGSTSDIRFYQVYGNFLENIWMGTGFCGTSNACSLSPDQIPDFEWIRLVGGVERFRIDSGTFIEGKIGLEAVANSGGQPHDISSFRYADDHVYVYGIDLQQATNADFVQPWINSRQTDVFVESGTSGNVRFSTQEMRGSAFEGARIEGGDHISLVNCQVGNNAVLWAPYNTLQTRPLSGVFLGASSGTAAFVGGMDGWISNANYANASVNNNSQSFGIVLATGRSTNSYTIYGTDLYGNITARVGQQVGGGTSANVLVP